MAMHPYTRLIQLYGPIGASSEDEGPLWTQFEQQQNTKFLRIKHLIEEKYKDVKPSVVLEKLTGPTQSDLS